MGNTQAPLPTTIAVITKENGLFENTYKSLDTYSFQTDRSWGVLGNESEWSYSTDPCGIPGSTLIQLGGWPGRDGDIWKGCV